MLSRRSFSTIIFIAVIMLAAVITYYGYLQSESQQRHVRLNGVFVLVDEAELLASIEDIIHQSDMTEGSSLKRIEALLSEEPFVESVSVRYAWPNELIIDIHEVSPRAIIRDHGYLSGNCEVIADERLLNVPSIPVIELEAIEFDDSSCARINKIITYVKRDIDHVVLMSNNDLRVVKGDIQYIIGEDHHAGFEKLFVLDKYLRQNGESKLIVDLRYVSGAAVREVAML